MSLNTYPGNPFPPSTEQMHEGDNEDLQAQIDAIKDGTTIDSFGDVESALGTKTDLEVIAPEFDAEAGTYDIGDLVTYQGRLYEFTSAHSTAGDWDSSEVSEKTVSDEIDTLKSGLTNVTTETVGGFTFYKVGRMVMLVKGDGVVSTNADGEILNGAEPLSIPSAYIPISTINFTESYANKRITISPATGLLTMPNDKSAASLTIRTSVMWIA